MQRDAAQEGWRCDGEVRSAGQAPLALSVDLATASTDAVLSKGMQLSPCIAARRPRDLTRIDLTRVPLAWSQALLSQAWPAANLKAGRMTGGLDIDTAASRPLRVSGRLAASGLGLDTQDGSIAAEGLGANLDIDYRSSSTVSLVTVDGQLRGGEMLAGSAYIALPSTPINISLAAQQAGQGGWEIPQLSWDDGDAMQVQGALGFNTNLDLQDADIRVESGDLTPLRPRYLSGWLGLFGLAELELQGAISAHVVLKDGEMTTADADLRDVSVIDAQDRFRFEGLSGKPVFSAGAAAQSSLHWDGGALQGLAFGPADLPLRSADGSIGLTQAISVPMLGGGLRIEGLNLRPPAGGRGMEFDFSLTLEALDVGQLAAALDWPAFKGQLDGHIPKVRYANDRLDLDGTLTAHIFDGTVLVSGLAMSVRSAPRLRCRLISCWTT